MHKIESKIDREDLTNRGLIEVRNLSVHFKANASSGTLDLGTRHITAVNRVSLDIMHGEVLSIVGESGSGKTTLGRSIIGLEKPTSGMILIEGAEQKYDRKSLRNLWRTTQMVFQDPYSTFNPLSTVAEILAIPVKKFQIAKDDFTLRRRIAEALSRTGLNIDEVGDKYPTQLSGGQRQRLAIARALIVDPKIIIADEPVSMLDVSLRAGILDLLVNLNRESGLTILFITHDLAVAEYISDRIAVMYRGEIVELGGTSQVVRGALHPYTELLLKSAPRLKGDQNWVREQAVVNRSSFRKDTCKYVGRCPLAVERCSLSSPALSAVEPGHLVSCFVRGSSVTEKSS